MDIVSFLEPKLFGFAQSPELPRLKWPSKMYLRDLEAETYKQTINKEKKRRNITCQPIKPQKPNMQINTSQLQKKVSFSGSTIPSSFSSPQQPRQHPQKKTLHSPPPSKATWLKSLKPSNAASGFKSRTHRSTLKLLFLRDETTTTDPGTGTLSIGGWKRYRLEERKLKKGKKDIDFFAWWSFLLEGPFYAFNIFCSLL